MAREIHDPSRVIRTGVISQDATLAPVLSSVLGTEFQVLASNGQDACSPSAGSQFDVFILDFDSASARAGQWSHLLENENSRHSSPPIVLIAGDDSRMHALEIVEKRGAFGYVRKPPAVSELKTILRSACERGRLQGELETARRQLENMMGLDQLIGSSAQMQLVYKLIRKVANLEASVLITGESGTGKELIARAIHNMGSRSKRPFVAVSCGAIPETLIESELFGHEKGAFTGTVGTREGYFEQVGDGTLFLDEIGELKPQTQVKLLRVLQEREFSRLGSSRTIPLRARVVFATHRDLAQMVAAGDFRQDLYYRINVMNIATPALRHHPADIPQLVQHFLRQYSELYRKPLEGIEPDALALLQSYPWTGNVRELGNVIQRSIIMAEGYSIQTTDLPESFQELEMPEYEDDLPSGSFERQLRDYKIKLAHDAIAQCNGNKTLAAQSLSISRAYLHRLIRQSVAAGEPAAPESGHGGLRIAAGTQVRSYQEPFMLPSSA
jgi:DNA-binding NtrC family response regulator